ncbi:hypothetical protein GS934_15925 [Rhodococcus hoagii]|nr:hypothetical protein [Prescottella equi]NKZ88106.1 hypothetical protein [Prescottella equi]
MAGRIAGRSPATRRTAARRCPSPRTTPTGVQCPVLSTPAKEAALVADTLRRAHLIDGVPWSEMAIVARSVPRVLPPLRRALLSAGCR